MIPKEIPICEVISFDSIKMKCHKVSYTLADPFIYYFQYHKKPPIILLDCSKLQLGRGRLDDTVSSFRRRLEQFRELTLPMLKSLDADGRLSIVDGDTDSPSVQREFERVVRQHTSRLNHETAYKPQSKRQISQTKMQTPQQHLNHDTIVEDLDNMPGTVPTISNHISLIQNGGE